MLRRTRCTGWRRSRTWTSSRSRRPTSRTSCGWRTATAAPAEGGPVRAFLGLGSNVGDREAHLAHAVRRLREAGRVTGISSVYETEPVGYIDQPSFLNLVVRLETRLPAADLLDLTRAIERERGRERTFRNAPRTLDIDLLLYGESVISEPGLDVPHPRMIDRPFVLVPLLELAPTVREPGTGRAYADIVTPVTRGIRRLYGGERLVRPAEQEG